MVKVGYRVPQVYYSEIEKLDGDEFFQLFLHNRLACHNIKTVFHKVKRQQQKLTEWNS